MLTMNPPKETVRVFFALWPGVPERDALARWQPGLKALCGGRVMRADTLHTTLVFLGEVAEERLEALGLAAQEVVVEPFDLHIVAAHYWGHNHIVFAAPDSVPPQLEGLVGNLERRLRKHRFHFEQRPYKPHVTLLRSAQWSDAGLPAMPSVHWRIGDFVLVRSLRDEQGAHYEVLARFGAAK